MKTVLAPNAPWPTYEPKPKPAPKRRGPANRKPASKRQNTDAKYEQWAKDNLGPKIKEKL